MTLYAKVMPYVLHA